MEDKYHQLVQRGTRPRRNSLPLFVEGVSCDAAQAAAVSLAVLVALGQVGLCMYRMNMPLRDAVYFMVISMSTTGYGDMYFTVGNRVWGGVYLFAGSAVVSVCVSACLVMHNAQVKPSLDLDSTVSASEILKASREVHSNFYNGAFYSLVVRMYLWLAVGTVSVMILEGWGLVDSFYWACVTLSCTGYGDICPQTSAGRWFCSLWLGVGCVFLMSSIAHISTWPLELRRHRTLQTVLERAGTQLEINQIQNMVNSIEMRMLKGHNADVNDNISRSEFIVWFLLNMQSVHMDEVQVAGWVFDCLDHTGDNVITLDDARASLEMRQHSLSSKFKSLDLVI
ncbi:MAG: uncharacterized protein KVP18_004162 [Porospora cf. gigantea A]|uniref:uncharacterized protein n=1 Tax=Porospora cf. gigantea A TaxID=2853593 RepID=UPI003559BE5A|nr:MAG: hypothetical protein KVP18_004162 [Porospora cf. gigantea A]